MSSTGTAPLHPRKPAARPRWRAYLALTKPRIIELLLIATVPPMFLAASGVPDPLLIVAALLGGALSAGSAGAFNCWADRDIDRVMSRTSDRPLVTGELADRQALLFSLALGLASVAVLAVFTNPLATGLSVFGWFFYAIVYTLWLKRRTSQNIVWGGIAGSVPVLVGWAAVTGSLAWPAFILAGVVFLWTPAHYWPLAMKYRADYEAADVPMLPAVKPRQDVVRGVVFWAGLTVVASIALIPVAGMGLFYALVAVVAALGFLSRVRQFSRDAVDASPERMTKSAMRVFHGSNIYLALVFLAVGADPLLPAWNRFLPIRGEALHDGVWYSVAEHLTRAVQFVFGA